MKIGMSNWARPFASAWRVLAFTLVVCATGQAWAAITADAVWEGGFTANSTKTGASGITYTLNLNGNTTDSTGDTLPISANLGAKITLSSSSANLAVLVKYSALNAAPTKTYELAAIRVKGKGWPGLRVASANGYDITGFYEHANTQTYGFSSTPRLSSTGGYFLLCHQGGSKTGGYAGSTLQQLSGGTTTSLKWGTGGTTLDTIVLGGPSETGLATSAYSGLVIEKVAIFNQVVTGADLATYYFPSDDPTALDYDFVKTISSNTALSEITTWDTGTGTPGAEDTVHIVCENSAVLTIDTAINADTLWVEGGSVTLANGASITANMVFGSPITVAASATASISGASVYNSIACGSYSTLNISNCAINGAITDGDNFSNTHATLNITDCAINGGITAGQNNNATINTAGAVVFRSSADNYFKYSSTLNVNSGTTTYNSLNSQRLWCNINVAKGATLVNSRDDSFDYGANANWPIHAYIRGTLTLNQKWTVAAGNYIHLYDDAEINGSASIHANVSGSQTKIVSENGTSRITAPVVKGEGSVSVQTKDGTTLVLTSSTELVKSGAGTLQLKDVAWTGAVSGSEGTVEVCNTRDTAHSQVSASGITFSGKIKFTAKGTYGVYVTNKDFLSTAVIPQLELDTGTSTYNKLFFKTTFDGVTTTIRDLMGSGGFTARDSYSVAQNQTFISRQTQDTEFSGVFLSEDGATDIHKTNLIVEGDGSGNVNTLKLSGANTSNGELKVRDDARVLFSSTGSWTNGTVTVADGGVLESQNSAAVAATLAVQEGATLKFANGVPLAATEYDWSGVSNDQSVNVDLSGIAPSATPVTLIASGVTIDAAKFKVSASQRTATLSVENGALKATFANFWTDGVWGAAPVANDSATLVLSQNSTLSVSEALTLGDITVENTSGGEVTLTVSGAGALTTGGWTIPAGVTVVTADGMEIAGDVTGGGVINVPANTTLTMDGVTTSGDTLADRVKVAVSGTLKTKGTTTLSAANTSAAGSLIEVVNGVTTLSSLTCGLSGNITIQSDGELKFAESYDASGADQGWDYLGTSSSNTVKVYGTLNMSDHNLWLRANNTLELYQGAEVLGSGDYASYYGSLIWAGNASLKAYGDAEINATITTLTDCSPVFNVAENKTLTISTAFIGQAVTITKEPKRISGGSITKAGAGTLDLTAITPTKPITINAGTVLAATAPTTAVVNENGVLNLTTSKDDRTTNLSGITGSGTIRYSGTSWRSLPKTSSNFFADTLSVELEQESGVVCSAQDTVIGSISGGKNLRTDLENYTDNDITIRTVTVKQAKDGTWEGKFTDDRLKTFIVMGGADSTGTLTLTATFTETDEMNVAANGSVKLADTCTWKGDVTVSGEFGGTGSIDGGLTLNAGSTFKVWSTDANGLAVSGALTLPASGKVTVDVSDLTIGAGDSTTLLAVGSGMPANVNKFALDSATHMLSISGQTLSLVPIAATLTSNGVTTPYATVDQAVGLLTTGLPGDSYVTLVHGTTSDLSYTDAQLTANNIVYNSANGRYVLAEAKIGTVLYPTIEAAIAAAAENDVVELARNVARAEVAVDSDIEFSEGSSTFSGSFTGSGTLILGAPLAAADPARWAEGWTGTVELKDITTVITDFDFADYGNANSTVRANNVLVRMPETGGEYGNVGEINLVGEGLRFGGDPIAGQDFTFSAAISGTGKIRVGTRCQTASPAHTRYIFKGDLSDFAGGVDYNDTGWYKATIVFQAGTDEIPAGNNGEWGQIILTENTTISLGGEMYGPAGIIVAGSINVLAGGSVIVDSGSGQKIEGSGTITYATFPASAPAFNNSWSGEVHLPGSASIEGTNFGNWGKSGSKIVLDGDVAGWIAQNTSVSAEFVLDGHSLTVNDFSPSSYSFSKISGSGNISFNHKENGYQPSSLTIGEIAPTYSGTVTNNTTATLNITTIALAGGASVAPGAKLLKIGGTGSFSVGSVTVGGVTQSGLQLAYVANDGVYVAVATYGGNGYKTLAEAIADAEAGTGLANIELLNGYVVPDGYYVSDGKVCKYQAAKVIPGPPLVRTYYETLAAAIDAANDSSYIEVLADNVEAESTAGSLFIKPNGHTFTITSPYAGFGEYTAGVQLMPDVYMYTSAPHEATFVWKTDVPTGAWSNIDNWTSTDGTVIAPPNNSLYNVSFGTDATVSLADNITVGAMEVGAELRLNLSEARDAVVTASDIVLTSKSASLVVVDRGQHKITFSSAPRTSLTGGAKVISTTSAGVTTYRVVYGTIFSVW